MEEEIRYCSNCGEELDEDEDELCADCYNEIRKPRTTEFGYEDDEKDGEI